MYSKGISWIDDCRIPFVDDKEIWTAKRSETNNPFHLTINKDGVDYGNTQGRFPANILVCDDMLNDGVYHKTGIAKIPKGKNIYGGNSLLNSKTKDFGGEFGAIGEKGGSNSRYYNIDKWFENLIDV